MKEGKKSFILYLDNLKISEKLSDKKLGKFFRAIIKYHSNENYELPKQLELVFEIFKNQFKRDEEKYHQICIRNRINGEKGGRPRTNPVGLSISQTNPTKPNKPKKAYNDNDSVTDNVIDNVKRKNNKKANASPLASIEEIEIYFLKRTNDALFSKKQAENFFDYYESNGWKVGFNPMKRWKNAVNGWINRQYKFEKEKSLTKSNNNSDNLKNSGLIIRKSKHQ